MINITIDPDIPDREFLTDLNSSRESWIEHILFDLFFLCTRVLNYAKGIEYQDLNWIHKRLCKFLDPLKNPIFQQLVLMARDMLKSSIGRAMMIQWFLQRSYFRDINNLDRFLERTEKILDREHFNECSHYFRNNNAFIYSGLIDLAQDHLDKVIKEIIRNPVIQAYFEGYIPTKKAEFDSCRLDEGRIRIEGIEIDTGSPEKSLTGHHFGLGMIDNLCNELNTQSVEMRKKTNKRWQQLESIFAEHSREVIFETPWATDDVSGIILHPEGKFNYKKLWRNPCYRFISDTGYAVFSCPATKGEGEIGEPVFPEKIDKEYLERKRRKQGRYIYSCLYELLPIPDEQVIIRPEWWHVYYEKPPMPFVRNICVDAAGGTDKSKSFSGVSIGEWDATGTLHIPYASKRNISPGELADWIIELFDMSQDEGRPVMIVGIEAEKYGIAIKEMIEVDRKRKDITVTLWQTRGLSRGRRQEELVPYFERRKILLSPGLRDFEDELNGFYKGKDINVDILDTIWGQFQLQILPKPGKMMTPQETAHAQIEREAKEFEQFERDRRSQFREQRSIASKF
jgi:hypothetical protein